MQFCQDNASDVLRSANSIGVSTGTFCHWFTGAGLSLGSGLRCGNLPLNPGGRGKLDLAGVLRGILMIFCLDSK
ncbi:hypothetical protein Y1Q_0018644 [Alligator mississippiensis]|uniref:Uncharacterized protein n=1 Tax=Alligator mississippiensis TaxID=8496 RepID=A0A151NRS7_ALLMI|nr:hypothetical protein Y1Q_0018644 [Alligator mississippiensis]